jgi:hypothetical protein
LSTSSKHGNFGEMTFWSWGCRFPCILRCLVSDTWTNWTNFFFKLHIPNLDWLVLWWLLVIASVKTAFHNDHWFCLRKLDVAKRPFLHWLYFHNPRDRGRRQGNSFPLEIEEKNQIFFFISRIRIYCHMHACCFKNICKCTSF